MREKIHANRLTGSGKLLLLTGWHYVDYFFDIGGSIDCWNRLNSRIVSLADSQDLYWMGSKTDSIPAGRCLDTAFQ